MLKLHLIQAVVTALILQCGGGSVMNNGGTFAQGNKVSNKRHVVKAIEKFTFSLYETVTENGYFDNLVISGVSLETVLALCSMGAVKTTKKQIQSALRLPRNQRDIKLGFKMLIDQLNNESYVTLNVVGAVYVDRSISIRTRFASVAQRYFKSMVVREDFQNNTSVAIADINSWVARVTKNTITELVGPDSVTPSTKLLLVNSMYFKGSWAAPFKSFLTKPCLFYIDTKNSITVSMMHQKGNFLYHDNHQLKSQILALNYQGNTMRLLIILPKKRDGLANLEKSFRRLGDLQLDRLNYTYINASIPKFEISYSKDFRSALQKLGMLAAFTPCADFSGISNYSDLFISSVLQKAYLKVDEEGTEAAAVSAVMMVRSSLRLTPANMVHFNTDHPFLFMVQHLPSKTIIFYGRVRRPSLA